MLKTMDMNTFSTPSFTNMVSRFHRAYFTDLLHCELVELYGSSSNMWYLIHNLLESAWSEEAATPFSFTKITHLCYNTLIKTLIFFQN